MSEEAGLDGHLDADMLCDYAEGGLGASARASADVHLRACEACRRELSAVQGYFRGMADLEPAQAPPGFLAGVHARLPKPSPWRAFATAWMRPWRAVPQLAVLTVLGIVSITAYLYQRDDDRKYIPLREPAPASSLPAAPAAKAEAPAAEAPRDEKASSPVAQAVRPQDEKASPPAATPGGAPALGREQDLAKVRAKDFAEASASKPAAAGRAAGGSAAMDDKEVATDALQGMDMPRPAPAAPSVSALKQSGPVAAAQHRKTETLVERQELEARGQAPQAEAAPAANAAPPREDAPVAREEAPAKKKSRGADYADQETESLELSSAPTAAAASEEQPSQSDYVVQLKSWNDTTALLAGLKSMGVEVLRRPGANPRLRVPDSMSGEVLRYLLRYGRVERPPESGNQDAFGPELRFIGPKR